MFSLPFFIYSDCILVFEVIKMTKEYEEDLKNFENHMYYIVKCAHYEVPVVCIETEVEI